MAGTKLVISDPKKIAEAVVYLSEATHVAGDRAQVGQW